MNWRWLNGFSFLSLLGAIVAAIFQYNFFSYCPTYGTVVLSLAGFMAAFAVRRKNRTDRVALVLMIGNGCIWFGYGLFFINMSFFWHSFG